MARKSHTNTAKPCQITPKLPFAVEPCHDLLTPAQERALIRATAQPGGSEIGDGRSGHTSQLQTATARFSELFRLARTKGPQLITRQGKDGVVMLPVEQFDQLVVRSRQPNSLVQFFRESPLRGLELDLERDQDTGRDIEL
jgi:prevent-host-death family protein